MRNVVVVVLVLMLVSFVAVAAPRSKGMPVPKDDIALVDTLAKMLPQLAAAGPVRQEMYGDADDVRDANGPDFKPVFFEKSSDDFKDYKVDGVIVTNLNPVVQLEFVNLAAKNHASLSMTRRKDSQPPVLVITSGPTLFPELPRLDVEVFRADTKWYVKKGASWVEEPLPKWFEPESTCTKTLTDAVNEIFSNQVLRWLSIDDDSKRKYTASLKELNITSEPGVTAKITLSKDKRKFTAEAKYKGGVARMSESDKEPTIVKQCVD